MSGIIGLINMDGAPVDPELLERLTASMAYRGPDAQATWVSSGDGGRLGRVGLGQAVLRTTFEAERETGPCSLDGRVWIAADARVDGRADLIGELHAAGQEVDAAVTDPELILHAYHAFGDACVEHLIGDFAFILWDDANRHLLCARDQFGAAAFYIARAGRTLIIGNTLHTVRRHPGVSDELDDMYIATFLLRLPRTDAEATAFVDIRAVAPCTAFRWSEGDSDVTTWVYDHLPEERDYLFYKRPEQYTEEFLDLFRTAVGDRLRTDRFIIGLSGGMDSTSVAAIAHELLVESGRPFDFQAYTVSVEDIMPDDEPKYARIVAEYLGIPQHIHQYTTFLRQERLPDGLFLARSPEHQQWLASHRVTRRASRPTGLPDPVNRAGR